MHGAQADQTAVRAVALVSAIAQATTPDLPGVLTAVCRALLRF